MKKRKELKKYISKTFKLGVIFMLLTSMLGLVGCSGKENKKPKEAKTAEKMLKEKYNEEFVTYSVGGRWGTLTNSTFTVICSPKDDPDLKFKAEIDKDGGYILDEYVSRKVSAKVEESFTKFFKDHFKDFVIKVDAGTKTIDSNKSDMPIEEFLKINENAKFAIDIVINKDNLSGVSATDLYNAMNSMLKTIPELKGAIEIYLVTNDVLIKANNYVKEKASVDSEFDELLKGSNSIFSQFKDGSLNISVEEFKGKYKAM